MEEKPSGKKRWLIGCGIIVAGLLFLLAIGIGLAAWVASAVFDPAPMEIPTEMADPAALMTASQKIQSAAMAGILDANPTLSQDTPTLLLELTGPEVNALLMTGMGLQQGMAVAEKGAAAERMDCRFEAGEFIFRVSKRMNLKTPFGEWVNVSATFVPEIRDGHLFVTLTGCRLGQFPAPLGKIQKRLSVSDIPEFEQSRNGQLVLRLIDRLETTDDGVAVRYRPQAVTEILTETGAGGALNMFDHIGEP
jgi:hypothetical protein